MCKVLTIVALNTILPKMMRTITITIKSLLLPELLESNMNVEFGRNTLHNLKISIKIQN
jgi:hypothetical protein